MTSSQEPKTTEFRRGDIRMIRLSITRYEGDDFPEAEGYAEFCASKVATLYPDVPVEWSWCQETRVIFVGPTGPRSPDEATAEDLATLIRYDWWDEFCQDGYTGVSAVAGTVAKNVDD